MLLKRCCFLLLSLGLTLSFPLSPCCPDLPVLPFLPYLPSYPSRPSGTSIIQVTATDADDPTYGNSAKLVYTLVQGQQYFSVDPQTGERALTTTHRLAILASRLGVIVEIPFFLKVQCFWFRWVTGVCARRASVTHCFDIRGPLWRANGGTF